MAKMNTYADTYEDMAAWLGNKSARTLGHNTVAMSNADGIAVILHSTAVITMHADGTYTLNSGGWRSVTTKNRINTFLPAPLGVSSTDGVWSLHRRGNAPGFVSEFYDGMRFDRHGNMVTDVLVDSVRELRRQKREIGAYVKLYTDEEIARLLERAQEQGTTGDCLYCNLGIGADMGTDHLTLHMEEGYTMASLAVNALKYAGYNSPGVILAHSPDLVRKAIRRYMVGVLTTNHGARPTANPNPHWT